MTKRLIELVLIVTGLVGFSTVLVQHFYPELISTPLPKSQWFYLGGSLVLATMTPFFARDIYVQSRKPFSSIIFLFICLLSTIAYGNLFLLIRLNSERAQATTETMTVTQDYRLKPKAQQRNVELAQFVPLGSLYQLSYSYPKAMYLNEDGQVILTNIYLSPDILKALKPTLEAPLNPEVGGLPENLRRSLQVQSLGATVELVSHSFLIEPIGPVKVPLVGGASVGFVISPQQIGLRRILIRSKLDPSFSKDLEKVAQFDNNDAALAISVLPERTIVGLSGPQLQQIQLITSSIGLPALLVAAITIWRESRKDQTDGKASKKTKVKK